MRPRGAAWLLLLPLALLLGGAAAAPLISVDLGGEFLKVGMVKAGSGFSVVINEMSKRRTSAQVAMVAEQRLLGEDAAALAPRHPGQVFARCVRLLRGWPSSSRLHAAPEYVAGATCAA